MAKKILFVRTAPNEFNPNTYNVQGFGLGKAFCRLGYDFDFLGFTKKTTDEYILAEEEGHTLRVILRPRIRVLRTSLCFKLLNKEFLSQYDYIISCEYGQLMTFALSRLVDNIILYSGPYYNMCLIPFMEPFYDALFCKRMNKNIKYKFVKSVLAKEYMEKRGFTNLNVLGVGLDFERFESNVEIQTEVVKTVNYMNDNECLLYVGALSDRKNFPFLLSVYKGLLETQPNLKFIIIGKGEQKYIDKTLELLSPEERKGLIRIEKIDNDQLRYIYPKAKVFLLPSKQEIFGMVLLEAMYLGTPIVSSRNGGALTLITDESLGQIVDEFDVDLWVRACERYLNDKEYTYKIVQNARKKIVEQYNWDALAHQMLEIIRSEK